MDATTWKGGTYGVRVGKKNAQEGFSTPRYATSKDIWLAGTGAGDCPTSAERLGCQVIGDFWAGSKLEGTYLLALT